MTAQTEEQTGLVGQNGHLHYSADGTFCVEFRGGANFHENCAYNAHSLRKWLIQTISRRICFNVADAEIAVGEAVTNAFMHCSDDSENILIVVAKVAFDDSRSAAVELVNVSRDCLDGQCCLPDEWVESKRGIPTIMALQKDGIINDVMLDEVELEGHRAVRFRCRVPVKDD